MNAEILSIGTELLLGEIVDTNSTHIARTLRDIGVNVYYMATVGDNLERIKENLLMSLSRSDLVITTGGLGPTVDDVTRQAVAAAVERELVFRPELLEQIAERFARFGVHMSDNNRLQAYLPAGAIPVENPVGTAPCYIVEDEKGIIISLPGVPAEMRYILTHNVLPYLREKMGGGQIIKARILRTAGIGESHLDEKIADLMMHSNPTVGLAAHIGQTDIRITARADDPTAADAMLDEMEAQVRDRVGKYIYAVGKKPLQNALIERLLSLGKKLAISETGTGGNLAQRLKVVSGAPEVLVASVQHSDVAALYKATGATATDDLESAAQQEVARLQATSSAQVVIVTVTMDEGTVIAAHTPRHNLARVYAFGGSDTEAAIWAGTWGLSLAYRLLQSEADNHEEDTSTADD